MVTDDAVIDFLEHHGVKGQKWGVRRRSSSSSGSSSSSASRKLSGDAKRAAALKKKKAFELSNKQLQDINSRQKLESTFVKNNPNAFGKGKVFVASALATAGLAVSVHKLLTSDSAKAAYRVGAKVASKKKAIRVASSTSPFPVPRSVLPI